MQEKRIPASLIESTRWTNNVLLGHWVPGVEQRAVIEPATGEVLGTMGIDDLDRARSEPHGSVSEDRRGANLLRL